MRGLRSLIIGLGIMLSSAAYGFIDTPVFLPSAPQAGETVSLSIRYGECDQIDWDAQPLIAQNGNTINVTIYGRQVAGALCNTPPQVFGFPIGSFASGNYIVRVYRFYVSAGNPGTTETLGLLSMPVGAGTSLVSVPSLGITGLLVLILGIWIVSHMRFKQKKTRTAENPGQSALST